MAAETEKDPGVYSAGQLGKIGTKIGVVLILIVALIWWIPDKVKEFKNESVSGNNSHSEPEPDSITETITVGAVPSRTIQIFHGFDKPRREIAYSLDEGNLRVIAEYNGGEANGGWTDKLSATSHAFHPGQGKSVRFYVDPDSPIKTGHVTYTMWVIH